MSLLDLSVYLQIERSLVWKDGKEQKTWYLIPEIKHQIPF